MNALTIPTVEPGALNPVSADEVLYLVETDLIEIGVLARAALRALTILGDAEAAEREIAKIEAAATRNEALVTLVRRAHHTPRILYGDVS